MNDPNGHTNTYTYDTLNRLAQTKDPSNGIYLNGYDTVGNLVSRKEALQGFKWALKVEK